MSSMTTTSTRRATQDVWAHWRCKANPIPVNFFNILAHCFTCASCTLVVRYVEDRVCQPLAERVVVAELLEQFGVV